ncbi:DUF3347 domain-containing protein [Chitinophaga filiformis]|uniref:DUF3347 domain-containing protein n=1 Tax=Chitinophaga filiformis TaxID=104663 RepID=A0A1G7M3R9_CHIFI|nr:DUF3347 domain-containing protein [Chitinophaga filiformis]SDF56294.1 Protein of unknown function [Chitinophaga filiformis]
MKQLIRAALPVLAVILFAACNNNPEAAKSENTTDSMTHEGHDHSHMSENSAPAAAAVQLKDDKLNAVYQHYVHLTTALINGDEASAKIASNAIEAGAATVDGGNALGTSAAKITAAKDIEAQRIAYADLSNNFISLVKKSGLNSGALYVDYCPMAMESKGAYWLSANEEVKNPYFGEKMMTCGEVKETLK